MLQFEGEKGPKTCDGLTRRDFLRVGAVGAGSVALSLTDLHANAAKKDINCVLLFLVGGPSQLDTWDLKPNAPDTIRGPFRPIQTDVAGIQISEHFPLMAQRTRHYAIVRSVHHEEAPIHETGQQMMQTGHLFRGGREYPHYGSVLSHVRGPRVEGMPPYVVLPAPLGNTGVSVEHGQGAGGFGAAHEPFVLHADPAQLAHGKAMLDAVDGAHRAFDADSAHPPAFSQLFATRAKKAFDLISEKDELRSRYGRNTFGQSCLLARRLIEHGVRLATVNMFDTVFNEITWDCHADGGALATTLDDYRDTLCPMFDRAYTALLDDLAERGLLESTLVVAMGEFGRTPQLNPRGGRDHWPGVWSMLFAGGGVRGGQVVGSSDRLGAEPRDRPVTPADVAATIYRLLGINGRLTMPGPDNQPMPIITAAPIEELLRG
ncbi:MAG TPA: DUF1501 domain-containing protein [Gemmataceae bacterium]|nr:DUF1501 domain-containing protein [Gemmataceae bacterium]